MVQLFRLDSIFFIMTKSMFTIGKQAQTILYSLTFAPRTNILKVLPGEVTRCPGINNECHLD